MDARALYDLSPVGGLLLLGAAIAAVPLLWLRLRRPTDGAPPRRLHALAVLTLFLTFDLVLFGAFTRLSDSGLGCPDWPGCYGSASPLGARDHIGNAQSALPSGPVTHGKAWVEMIHRYLATAVGLLILVLTVGTWRSRWRARQQRRLGGLPSPATAPMTGSPWWALATLIWVCIQGAFGALTVTMRLYPAVVTAHLLGGLVLLALLTVQCQAGRPAPLTLPRSLHGGAWVVLALASGQMALGGWVSTNYAVLACSDFPTCQGSWWPVMDAARGFTLWRALGTAGSAVNGQATEWLPFAALTAIHMAHRMGAAVVLTAMALLARGLWALSARQQDRTPRRWALAVLGIGTWQTVSGVGNVVLGWPLAAALAHTAGAAALVVLLTALLVRARQAQRLAASRQSARRTAFVAVSTVS